MDFIVCEVNIDKVDFLKTQKVNFKGQVKLTNLWKQNQEKDYKEAILDRKRQLQTTHKKWKYD